MRAGGFLAILVVLWPRSAVGQQDSGKAVLPEVVYASSPTLLSGIRLAYVNIFWRSSPAGSRIPIDTGVLRNIAESALRRDGIRVSRDHMVLVDSNAVEIRLDLTSLADGGAVVTALDLRCIDVGAVRRVPKILAALPVWDSGIDLQLTPTGPHGTTIESTVRYLFELFSNSLHQAPR